MIEADISSFFLELFTNLIFLFCWQIIFHKFLHIFFLGFKSWLSAVELSIWHLSSELQPVLQKWDETVWKSEGSGSPPPSRFDE